MQMTDGEVVRNIMQAKDQKAQIKKKLPEGSENKNIPPILYHE